MFKRVLLCFDGSAAGRRALRRGAELAIFLNAQVHLLAIVPTGVVDPVVVAGANGHACIVGDGSVELTTMMDESIKRLTARGVTAHGHLASGDAYDQIIAHSKRLDIDLIVLGHYPQPSGGFWWWTGNQRGSLAERANCCVFVAVDGSTGAAVSS
jgi:nucleotide-binding universal stress UspA family protein